MPEDTRLSPAEARALWLNLITQLAGPDGVGAMALQAELRRELSNPASPFVKNDDAVRLVHTQKQSLAKSIRRWIREERIPEKSVFVEGLRLVAIRRGLPADVQDRWSRLIVHLNRRERVRGERAPGRETGAPTAHGPAAVPGVGAVERLGVDAQCLLLHLVASAGPIDQAKLRDVLDERAVACLPILVTQGFLSTASGRGFTVEPALEAPLRELFVRMLADEVQFLRPRLLRRVPLINLLGGETEIRTQKLEVVAELARALERRGHDGGEVLHDATQMFDQSRAEPANGQDYLAGNLINLLAEVRRGDLSRLDLSGLTIRHAYLKQVIMRGARLDDSLLEGCAFADTFGSIWKVGFLNGGEEFAASGVTGDVRVWSVRTGLPTKRFGKHHGWSFGFDASADGADMASAGGDWTIRIWGSDPPTEDILRGHTSRVRAVAFHQDGYLLSCSEDATVRSWSRSFGGRFRSRTLYEHGERVTALAITPDGAFAISGSGDGQVVVWNLRKGAEAHRFSAHGSEIRNIAVAADGGSFATASDDGRAIVWSLNAAAPVARQTYQHPGPVKAVAFSQAGGGGLFTGCDDRRLRLWNEAEAPTLAWVGHENWIRSIAVSGDDALVVSGGDDQTVRVWRRADDGSYELFRSCQGHMSQARALAFTADRELVTAHDDAQLRIWDLATGHLARRPFVRHATRIWSLAFSPNGERMFSGAEDGVIRAWEGDSRSPVWDAAGHVYRVFAIAVQPVGEAATALIASGGADKTVRLWRMADGAAVDTLSAHTRRVRDVSFSPDGRRLASASEDGSVALWREDENEGGWRVERRLQASAPLTSVRFSPAGDRLATAGEDGLIMLWDPRSGDRIAVGGEGGGPILSLAYSPEGDDILTGHEDGSVRLWGSADLVAKARWPLHDDWVEQVVFSPDGSLFASASDDQFVVVCDRQTGARRLALKEDPPYHGMTISGARISPSQRATLVALGAQDGDS